MHSIPSDSTAHNVMVRLHSHAHRVPPCLLCVTTASVGSHGRPALIRREKSGAWSAAWATALMCAPLQLLEGQTAVEASSVIGVLRRIAAQQDLPRVGEEPRLAACARIMVVQLVVSVL